MVAVPAAILLTPEVAKAEVSIGPHGGIEFRGGAHLALGGELRLGLTKIGSSADLTFRPAIDVYLGRGTFWQLSGDFLFDFLVSPTVQPYVGLGPALVGGGDAYFGVNLVFGAKFNNTSTVQPFVELRPTFGDASPVCLLGGVMFRL